MLLQLLEQTPAAFISAALLLGLMVGSFLNVVIYRLPLMLERQWREQCSEILIPTEPTESRAAFNLAVPASACPACKAPIRAWQNIPVLSWLALRGRCANCKAPISARYPLVELLSGIASALVAWKFGFGWPAACALLISWFLIAMTFIDLDHQLLPDALTLPLLWLGLVASLGTWTPTAHSLPVAPASAITGAIAGYVSLWAVYHVFRLVTGKEGMGYGDFKLLAALGAWLGWQMLLPIVLASAAVGALVGIVLIATGRQARGTPIPYGPFLATAGWLAMMWGPEVITRYLGLYAARS